MPAFAAVDQELLDQQMSSNSMQRVCVHIHPFCQTNSERSPTTKLIGGDNLIRHEVSEQEKAATFYYHTCNNCKKEGKAYSF